MENNDPSATTLPDTPRIIHLREVVSTNSAIREIMDRETLPEGSVVWADFQNAGRGQLGNHWESEPGKNLTFSTLLYPTILQAKEQFLISQIAALSVKKTLDRYVEHITIKWPNDIYWQDKKICGMLIENDLAGFFIYCSIIGIGINLNQEVFGSDALNPVSLWQITGKHYDGEEVLKQFLSHFYPYYLLLLQEKQVDIRREYRASLYRGEGWFPFQDMNGVFEAAVKDIEPTGHLLLCLPDGEVRRYAFKEVSWLSRE